MVIQDQNSRYRKLEDILNSDESVYSGFEASPKYAEFFPNLAADFRSPGSPRITFPVLTYAPKIEYSDRFEPLRRIINEPQEPIKAAYSPSQLAAVQRAFYADRIKALSQMQSEAAKEKMETERQNMAAKLDVQARNQEAANRAALANMEAFDRWQSRADSIYKNNIDLMNANYAQQQEIDKYNLSLYNQLQFMKEMMERDVFWKKLQARLALMEGMDFGPSIEIPNYGN